MSDTAGLNGSVLLRYRVDELDDDVKQHEQRIRALEIGYAKLFALATLGAAIGSFLAGKVF